jgi:large subunit ribosomal protein L3
VGPGTDPSRIIKGKRMPGHMGAARHTETGLQVVKIDAERNLLFVRGAVPGPSRGIVLVRKQGGRSRYA